MRFFTRCAIAAGLAVLALASQAQTFPSKTVRLDEVGSVGSASIPISLDRLRRTHGWGQGQHVLMVGVGSGVSYGATLYRVGT